MSVSVRVDTYIKLLPTHKERKKKLGRYKHDTQHTHTMSALVNETFIQDFFPETWTKIRKNYQHFSLIRNRIHLLILVFRRCVMSQFGSFFFTFLFSLREHNISNNFFFLWFFILLVRRFLSIKISKECLQNNAATNKGKMIKNKLQKRRIKKLHSRILRITHLKIFSFSFFSSQYFSRFFASVRK